MFPRFVKYGACVLVLLFGMTDGVSAQALHRLRHLTAEEIGRLKAVKAILGNIDPKSLGQYIAELEQSKDPLKSLEMKEAMAKAYADIVQEEEVQGQKKKEWLYSMVCLNMAYLQFGGSAGTSRDSTDLNRLIRRKLIAYLPAHALQQPGFVYTLQ